MRESEPIFHKGQRTRIKDVRISDDGWTITTLVGFGFFLEKKYDCDPQVGDEIEIATKNISQIRGVALNGEIVFYKSDRQLDLEHEEYRQKQERDKKADFEKNRAKYDLQYEKLPDVFKMRLDRFRRALPDWRWEYEPYEIFCCTQAVAIADALKTEKAIQDFAKLDFAEQQKLVPGLSDGHSGNTFGTSCRLAQFYVSGDPDLVWRWHGALCNLVGCEAYGCRDEDRAKITLKSTETPAHG